MYREKSCVSGARYQRGFLLPLALFILVVMGALALTISRTSTQTQSASIQEFTNVQAFYAAESGAQRGMQALFLNNSPRQATDATCTNMLITPDFTAINGLRICTARVTCRCVYQNNAVCAAASGANYLEAAPVGVSKSFYTITSHGSCGEQNFRAVRTIEVSAFLD
jgi:MSHA biogenesis protein MshP